MLGGTIVYACGALARGTLARTATLASDRAAATAPTALQQSLATAIANGADPRSLRFAPIRTSGPCVLTGNAGVCLLNLDTTVASVMLQPVSGSNTAEPCEPRCAFNVQANDGIEEGRISARMVSTITGPNDAILARRGRYVTLRTMRAPPYAVLVGSRDATNDRFLSGSAQGDDGGAPATVVSVRYRNVQSGAESDGNAWQSSSWSSDDALAGWSP